MNTEITQDPVEMETPEEWRPKVWFPGPTSGPVQVPFRNAPELLRTFSRKVLFVYVSQQAASIGLAANRLVGFPYEVDLGTAIEAAISHARDLVLLNEALEETDRWEYKP